MTKIEIDAVKIQRMNTITVSVQPKRMAEARMRMWLACRFIRMGAWIANMNFKMDVNEIESKKSR